MQHKSYLVGNLFGLRRSRRKPRPRYKTCIVGNPARLRRDRRERSIQWLWSDEYGHRGTLPTNQVFDRGRDLFPVPQPPGAPMSRPPLSQWRLHFQFIQMPACKGLEVVHNPLRPCLRRHNQMHVIRAYVGGLELPAAIVTAILHRFQHSFSAASVKAVGRAEPSVVAPQRIASHWAPGEGLQTHGSPD